MGSEMCIRDRFHPSFLVLARASAYLCVCGLLLRDCVRGHEDNEAHPFAYAMAREGCKCGGLLAGFQLLLASLLLDLAAAPSLAWLMPGIARMHVTIDLRLIRVVEYGGVMYLRDVGCFVLIRSQYHDLGVIQSHAS